MIRPALWTAFGVYCFVLIYILFLSRGPMIHYSYAQYFRQFTNFIPFKTIIEYVQRYHNGFRNLSVLNLLANKTLIQLDWIALDGGILISWLSFMCMDIITKHFGPKASNRISILAAGINLLTCHEENDSSCALDSLWNLLLYTDLYLVSQ